MGTTAKLAGRVAVVTGGGGGLGGAVALALAGEGAVVVVSDVDAASATRVASECQEHVASSIGIAADVANSASVAALFDAVDARCGRVDILVTAAGISSTADTSVARAIAPEGSVAVPPAYAVDIATIRDETWRQMLAVHLDGTFYCARAAVPRMAAAGAGSIVCFSSIAGTAGIGPLHYAAAKGGILGLVRGLARSVAASGIRVNAVCPGGIAAGMTLRHPRATLEEHAREVPVGRLGTAQEVAAAVLYLASDDASYTTGQVLSPNGGSVIS
ncbi:MAG TPA: SDR family NAD(P)-dependent oxidoreductase [Acidimicrobiales bacterium]|jgi:3-oxoacyl-[acyl-carrier protein] reductase|nr:SDR family NAD(P)-dependent oxidoreductase [Acidimicrobiales bacterium]